MSTGTTRARAGGDRLSRLYGSWAALAGSFHRRRVLVAALGAPVLVLALVAINRYVLLGFPNSGDEYAYLYQAQTIAEGRLWNAPIGPAVVFETNYIVQEPDRVFGSFPAGWPVALAAAIRLGLPPWALNPILGAVTIGLVWRLGTRLYGARAGVSAAALVVVSPFFLFNAASYFSHTFCGALLLGAACLASREDRAPAWVPLGTGLLVGWAVLARYFTGVACGVPIVLWLLRPGTRRVRSAALVALGGLPWVVLLAWYNTQFSGSPWRLTTRPLTYSLWFAGNFLLRGADMLATHVLRHLAWTPAVLLAAYAVYLRGAPRALRRGPLDWVLVIVAGCLYFYIERGGNQYGPRFHYEAFLFMVVFVAGNLFASDRIEGRPRRDRLIFGLLAASVAAMPASFAAHAMIEKRVIVERMDPYARVAAAGPKRGVVLLDGRVGTRRSMAGADLTRNGNRPAYVYRWDRARAAGTLAPLACP